MVAALVMSFDPIFAVNTYFAVSPAGRLSITPDLEEIAEFSLMVTAVTSVSPVLVIS